jgi:hypothetical protein
MKRSALTHSDASRLAVKPKKRTCKVCKAKFETFAPSFVNWCSPECGAALAEIKLAAKKAKEASAERKRLRQERAEDRKKLEEHKPLSYWEKKTERACNAYIRARDPDICISCGVTQSSAWQAGHYISVGANSTLRYNEFNINKQCIQCNMFKGSNATQYRIGLVAKYGVERVEWLEGWHAPIKMTREACQEIEAYYKAKLRALLAERKE